MYLQLQNKKINHNKVKNIKQQITKKPRLIIGAFLLKDISYYFICAKNVWCNLMYSSFLMF